MLLVLTRVSFVAKADCFIPCFVDVMFFLYTGAMGGNGQVMMTPMQSMKQHTAANPLYGSPPSPLSSQAGMYGNMAPMAQAPAASMSAQQPPSESEAAVLQQLMNEINRLKNELGTN